MKDAFFSKSTNNSNNTSGTDERRAKARLSRLARRCADFFGRVAVAGIVAVGVGLTFAACEKEPTEVQCEQLDNISEILDILGEDMSIVTQIESNVKQKFGDDLVYLLTSRYNGVGNVVAFFEDDGEIKKATTEVNVYASDFDAMIYEYDTFTKDGDDILFFLDGKQQLVELDGKFVSEESDGLAVIDTSFVEDRIRIAVTTMQTQTLGWRTDLDETGKQAFKTLLGFVVDAPTTAHLPWLSLGYDQESNKTTATYFYLRFDDETAYTQEGSIIFEGDLIQDGALDLTAAAEQLLAQTALVSDNVSSYIVESSYYRVFVHDNFDSNAVELEVATGSGEQETPESGI